MKVSKLFILTLFSVLGVCLFGGSLQAQDAFSVAERPWKAKAAVSTEILVEIAQKNAALSSPNLPYADKQLYRAYVQVLGMANVYVQSDQPVGQSMTAAFKQVIANSATDPGTKGVESNQLADLMMPIIEQLAELPQMAPQTAH
jgi:hypothetical protein